MFSLDGLYQVIVIALATAAISVTTSKARVFAAVRIWIARHSEWFGDLVYCTYCTSHWVAIAFVALYRPTVLKQWFALDLIVSLFVTVALAAVASGVITKLLPFNSVNSERLSNETNH